VPTPPPIFRRFVGARAQHDGAANRSCPMPAPMAFPVKVPRLRCDLVLEAADGQQESGLSVEFLRHFCETDELDLVTRLDIQVDSVRQNIEPLGEHLKNLCQLRLTDSSVICLRDLGTELSRLEILWMSRCGLQDLGGAASALPALRELYIPFNDISDLSPLRGHERIEVLDLEGNAVADLGEVAGLGWCPQLRELTLRGNLLHRSVERRAVLDLLPQLAVLDDVGVDSIDSDRAEWRGSDAALAGGSDGSAGAARDGTPDRGAEDRLRSPGCPGNADVEPIRPLEPFHPLLAQGLQESQTTTQSDRTYAGEPDEDELVVEELKRARPKPMTFHAFTARPALSRSSFNMQPPDRRQVRTADSEPTALRPATATNSRLDFDDLKSAQDSASDLTCGAPLAGGPLTAVRQRRVHAAGAQEAQEPELGIRELLRRYRTYTQPSCIPSDELLHRKREADGKRPGTPDVRIHVPTPLQASGAGRAATSAGLDAASLPRNSRSGAGSDDSLSSPPVPLDRKRNNAAVPSLPCPPARGSGGTVVPPSVVTSLGETLFIDTETAVDLE